MQRGVGGRSRSAQSANRRRHQQRPCVVVDALFSTFENWFYPPWPPRPPCLPSCARHVHSCAAAGEAARAQGNAALVHEVGPEGWQDAEDEYTFRYTRDGAHSGLYQLSALMAGDKLLVDAAPPAPARVAHLELRRVVSCAARRGQR